MGTCCNGSNWMGGLSASLSAKRNKEGLQLSGTNSLFLSVICLCDRVLFNLPCKPFSFQKPFLQSHCPDTTIMVDWA